MAVDVIILALKVIIGLIAIGFLLPIAIGITFFFGAYIYFFVIDIGSKIYNVIENGFYGKYLDFIIDIFNKIIDKFFIKKDLS